MAMTGSEYTKSIVLNEENFTREVLETTTPVMVDFWAAWCGPCRMLAPIVEAIAADFAERAKVGKVNIDDAPSLASKYGIHAVPTLLFFQNGVVVDQIVGVLPQEEIADKLNVLLEPSASQTAA
jgi:thioredoxin 1